MFSKAKNTVITGGLFQMQQVNEGKDDQGHKVIMEVLRPKVALGAFHDSAERRDPPRCHPGTRTHILEMIMSWVRNVEKTCMFMWLYGPAGAGKSAIAQTLAEMCHSANLLAATFFFSHMAMDRNNERALVSTIVYQLILFIPEIRSQVVVALEQDPLLLTKAIDTQLHELLVIPLNEAAEKHEETFDSRPRCVILDGLDECSDARTQLRVLKSLARAVERLSTPLFFLIATRPEFYLRKTLSQFMGTKTNCISLDDKYHPDVDIGIFIRSKFADIQDDHPAGPYLPEDWPSEDDISRIITKSSGQFIYASTVMRFVEAYQHMPTERLKLIFSADPSAVETDTPFAELDALYSRIFSAVASHNISKVLDILSILLLTANIDMTPDRISEFLSYGPGEVYTVLTDLHSLISIPSADDEPGRHLYTFHASLADFLLDSSRSGEYFIDKPLAYSKLVRRCLTKFAALDISSEARNVAHSIFKDSIFHADHCPEMLMELCRLDVTSHLQWLSWGGRSQYVGIDSFLNVHSGPVFVWDKIPSRTPFGPFDRDVQRFVVWLHSTTMPSTGTTLFNHHHNSFDNWMLSELGRYHEALGRNPLIALLELERKDLAAHFGELYTALVHTLPLYYWEDEIRSDRMVYVELESLPTPVLDVEKYLDILRAFFSSPQRSGVYGFDAEKCLQLAMSLLRFISRKKKHPFPHVEDAVLNLLPGILAKASKASSFNSRMNDLPESVLNKVRSFHQGRAGYEILQRYVKYAVILYATRLKHE